MGAFWRREYSLVEAVKGISFEVAEGELVGFLGPNGAGKTTTLKMISGLLYPSSGTARTLGFTPSERREEFLRQITLVMGNRSQLWWEIPIEESFRLNKEIYEMDDSFYRQSLGELVELLDLHKLLSSPSKKLSLGERMKAELAAALLHRPGLLLLDEPTLGLDIVMQKKVRQFLLEYNRRYRATILLTSHNMDDVVELCRRIIVIDQGRLIYDGGLKSLIERYAPMKRLLVDFSHPPEAQALAELGLEAVNGSTISTEIRVPREQIPTVAARILKESAQKLPPIVDLTIEETPVEDVIRAIFEKGR